ncbi:MAG TPA: hypothetical protein VG944_07775 [Fimbriimonas sp.]|nr:hypothetical protein [Fimbriimonas sp.]
MQRLGLAAAAVLAAGCGGGQTSHSINTGSSHTTLLGEGTISYYGQVVPSQTFTQNGVLLAAMAGANITSVTLNPSQTLKNSLLAYVRGGQLWTYHNGVNTEITHLISNNLKTPSLSHTGKIVFVGNDSANNPQLYTCNYDGSGLVKITSGALSYLSPSWSPSGTKIVFSDFNTSELYTITASGASLTDLHQAGDWPAWSPDGTKIAFSTLIASATSTQVYTIPSGGGTPTLVSKSFGSDTCVYPAWSPDGSQIAFAAFASTGRTSVFAEDSSGGIAASGITNPASGYQDLSPSFAPDGTTLAFNRVNDSADTSEVDSTSFAFGSSTTQIDFAGRHDIITYPSWSPYFGKKAFVGSGGILANAAGFIWSELDGFASFMGFTATNPASATITSQNADSSSGGGVFLLKADNIAKIVYTNSYYGAIESVTVGAPQVLVSFNATTGAVETIAPLASRGSRSPASPSTGKGMVYSGQFLAVYSQGKNVAPSGASQIVLDPKTGAVQHLH